MFFIHIIIQKKIRHIAKDKQKNKRVYIHDFIQLIIMKMEE